MKAKFMYPVPPHHFDLEMEIINSWKLLGDEENQSSWNEYGVHKLFEEIRVDILVL